MERREEAKRWFKQSLRDIKAAKDSFSSGNFEWACFQAQQAAEKAVKALHYALGRSSWGHSILELLNSLSDLINIERFLPKARELDRHYIPSRYPNAFESGYPALYYDSETAERAVKYANDIIEWVKGELKRLGVSV
ncbi:MAG TPA: HEPN domain-containing protein [Thermofilum sp.]|nr:HEPN domain-containing protein [Thermofilum sp.]